VNRAAFFAVAAGPNPFVAIQLERIARSVSYELKTGNWRSPRSKVTIQPERKFRQD